MRFSKRRRIAESKSCGERSGWYLVFGLVKHRFTIMSYTNIYQQIGNCVQSCTFTFFDIFLCMVKYPCKIICKVSWSQKDDASSIVRNRGNDTLYLELCQSRTFIIIHWSLNSFKWSISPSNPNSKKTALCNCLPQNRKGCPKACWWHRGPKFENCLCRPGRIIRI